MRDSSSGLSRALAVGFAISLLFGASAWPRAVSAAAPPLTPIFRTGAEAATYELPATGMHQVFSWTDTSADLVFNRYQQRMLVNGNPVDVDGAQVTIVTRNSQQVLVAGRYAEGVTPAAAPTVSPVRATAAAAANVSDVAEVVLAPGALTNRSVLMFDPDTRRLFYRVESKAPGVRVFTDVDAATGAVLSAWSALDAVGPGTGTGVKGDTKILGGSPWGNPIPDLTTQVPPTTGAWLMRSAEVTGSRYITYNAGGNSWYPPANPMSDPDNQWVGSGQRAAVDAQYYAALTDHFYSDSFGFDVVNDCLNGPLMSVVHYAEYGQSYDNAFWDGAYMVYGDGNGSTDVALSAGQDVVTHELSHAVTECRASLNYKTQSGALNEAFSDMMGTAAEWDFAEPNSSNCRRAPGQTVCPDWWLGEDIIVGGPDWAIRNLANPRLLGQPSHWADRRYLTSTYDNGGVHYNSGIANHAFYLMVAGGRNARCSGLADAQADCDVSVPGIPMADAQHIIFDAWQGLTFNADFCSARDMTVAMADLLYPDSPVHTAAADLAWRAVGVDACTAPNVSIQTASPFVAVAPGGSANVVVNTATAGLTLEVLGQTPANATFTPNPTLGDPENATTLTFDVPADAPDGSYPLAIRGYDDTNEVFGSINLVVDGLPPSASISQVRVPQLGVVTTAGMVPMTVTWSASDALSGLTTIDASVDSSSIGSSSSGTATTMLAPGVHSFSVTAADRAGNSTTSAPLSRTLSTSQENGATYSGSWSAMSASPGWGTTRFSKVSGATARFTFTGTDVAWVSTRNTNRGRAKVFIDGVLKGKIDTRANNLQPRTIVYSVSGLAAGQHTLRIVVLGTSGRPRVDIEGFVVTKP